MNRFIKAGTRTMFTMAAIIGLSIGTAAPLQGQTKKKTATTKTAAKPVAKPTTPAAKTAETPPKQSNPAPKKSSPAKKTNSSPSETFGKGNTVLNLGIGLGSTYGFGYKSTIPPLSAMLEFCVKDHLFNDGKGAIGVGPYVGYASYKFDTYGDYSFTRIVIAARGNLHYQFADKLDTYVGLQLGYDIIKWNTDLDFIGNTASGVYFGGEIGARYYFSKNIAAMAELGYGVTWLNVGAAIKF
jgi:hypothetical protein